MKDKDINKNQDIEICPICGDTMHIYDYAYDHNQYGKVYYKCDTCGHKTNTMN